MKLARSVNFTDVKNEAWTKCLYLNEFSAEAQKNVINEYEKMYSFQFHVAWVKLENFILWDELPHEALSPIELIRILFTIAFENISDISISIYAGTYDMAFSIGANYGHFTDIPVYNVPIKALSEVEYIEEKGKEWVIIKGIKYNYSDTEESEIIKMVLTEEIRKIIEED